jgi:dipeptidyl-peptidase III
MTTRRHLLERVDEAAVVQLYADGFAALSLNDKILVWHLYRAALAGRDIYYDQRYAHNLAMREVFEQILRHATAVDPASLAEIRRYAKLFWINTGPYNYLTSRKFVMRLTGDQLRAAVVAAAGAGARFPLAADETPDAMASRMAPLFLDASVRPRRSVSDEQVARRRPRHPRGEHQ